MTAQHVLWDEAISFPSTIATNPPQHWVSVGQRVMNQASTGRGRQYEWDQVQTGTYSPTLSNQDGAFNPVNTASPYAPNVLPRRPYRKRYQYPATQNILTVDQATAGSTQAAGSRVDNVVPVWLSYVSFWTVTAEVDAFTGPNVFQQVLSTGPGAGAALADMDGWSALPGAWHSAQVWMRATAGGTTPQMRLVLVWRNSAGTNLGSIVIGSPVTLTANSRVWQQLTVSAQAPVGACGATVQIQMANSVAVTLEAGGFQIEYAQNPTAWTQPGNWYSVISGWTDRFPQVKDRNGTYVLAQPKVVDSFARLAALYPPPPFYADVLALGPAFFFPLDDPNVAVSCRELTGTYNPAPVVNSQQGAGSLKLGQGIQSTSPTTTILGAPGGVAQFNNVDSGSSSYSPGTWIELDKSGIAGPPAGSGWTRMIAFNCPSTPTNSLDSALWVAAPSVFSNPGSTFTTKVGVWMAGVSTSPQGCIYFQCCSGDANAIQVFPGINMCDGAWHLVFFSLDSTGKNFSYSFDGGALVTTTATTSQMPARIATDAIGERVVSGSNWSYEGMQGSLAHAAQWNYQLSNAQITVLYQSWRFGWQGDSSGLRYLRVLGWAGYTGPTVIEFGNTTSMGPATDVDGNTDALTLLSNVVTTENGTHYMRADGVVRFEARSHRYNQLTPSFTFGNLVGSGEYPFWDVAWDFDLDHVADAAQVTVTTTNQVFAATSSAAQAQYDTLTMTRSLNITNPQEAVDAANYLVNRYDQPLLRCASLTLNPARYSPDGGVTFPLYAVCGQLDISTRIRINDRPLGQPAIVFDGFVENVAWTVDPSTGDQLVVLQCSPANLNLYWVNAALHTTSAATMTSGTNAITLNPLPDACVNPFSASVCSGLTLTLEPGTANAETLTVSSVAGGIPMAPNGAFVVDASGWGGSHSATLAQMTTTAVPANVPQTMALATATQNTQTSGIAMAASATGFTAGITYRFECWVNPTATLTFTTNIDWFTSGGTPISTTTVTTANVVAGQWTKLVGTHLAPATAALAAAYVLGAIAPIGTAFQITAIWVGTSPVVTFTANAAHTHAANAVVCEPLPATITDPSTWDSAAICGVTTTPSY